MDPVKKLRTTGVSNRIRDDLALEVYQNLYHILPEGFFDIGISATNLQLKPLRLAVYEEIRGAYE